MSWFPIVLATIGAEYGLGILVMLIYHFAETGWYNPNMISPRPTKWCYRWWGRPIAVLWDALCWRARNNRRPPSFLIGRIRTSRHSP